MVDNLIVCEKKKNKNTKPPKRPYDQNKQLIHRWSVRRVFIINHLWQRPATVVYAAAAGAVVHAIVSLGALA